ncbi:MAG: FadR family transcriptional regulator [Acidobacteria bacterium]|nr:FadR family transcriptional regulator [Acidobacteriota bacterium]
MLDVQFPMFESVPTSRVSEAIANQMKQVILAGKLRPGDKLTTEREMVEQFGTRCSHGTFFVPCVCSFL